MRMRRGACERAGGVGGGGGVWAVSFELCIALCAAVRAGIGPGFEVQVQPVGEDVLVCIGVSLVSVLG